MTSSVGARLAEPRKLLRVTCRLAVTVTGMTAALAGSWNCPEASVRTLPAEDSITAPETGLRLSVSRRRPLTDAPPAPTDAEVPVGDDAGRERSQPATAEAPIQDD